MSVQSFGAYQTKIHQFAFGLGFVALALYAARSMLSGSRATVCALAGVTVGLTAFLKLDKWYWLFFPLLAPLPLPFLKKIESSQLGAVIVVAAFLARRALNREKVVRPSGSLSFFVPFAVWIVFIYMLNPAGMFMFGSSVLGAKAYFTMLVAFLFLETVSRLEKSEDEMKRCFQCVVMAQIAGVLLKFLLNAYLSGAAPEMDEFEGGATRYSYTRALPFVLILLCRHSLSDIFHSPRLLGTMALLSGMTIYSGKRSAFAQLFLYPLLSVVFRERDKLLFVLGGLFVAVVLGVVAAGHGVYYQLPLSVQRGISFLPGKWDAAISSTQGFKDTFREELRRTGIAQIRENPWTGSRGYGVSSEEAAWTIFSGSQYSGHELMGGWHNVWIGTAATFGIPGAVLFGMLSVAMTYAILVKMRWLFRFVGGYRSACAMYFGTSALALLSISYWSGNTASAFSGFCFHFGMFLLCSNVPVRERPIPLPIRHPLPTKEAV